MKWITLVFLGVLAGCGQGDSSAGVEDPCKWEKGAGIEFPNGDCVAEMGDGQAAVAKTKVHAPSIASQTSSKPRQATQGIGRTLALRHTIAPGRAVRWPSRTVSISTNAQWARNAAHLWVQQGFKFRMGTGNQIVFMGYSTARNSVGWSRFDYRNGKITQCRIWINPRYLRRYDIANTFSHELGHCLGLGRGHIGIRGNLMAKFGGRKISPQTAEMFRYLYSIKPGGKL